MDPLDSELNMGTNFHFFWDEKFYLHGKFDFIDVRKIWGKLYFIVLGEKNFGKRGGEEIISLQ